jgi:hypothetical protein
MPARYQSATALVTATPAGLSRTHPYRWDVNMNESQHVSGWRFPRSTLCDAGSFEMSAKTVDGRRPLVAGSAEAPAQRHDAAQETHTRVRTAYHP